MIRVFIGGSRHIGRMNGDLARRLDNIIGKDIHVLIGDAKGFDRLAQEFLAERGYRHVLVYCTAGVCRNNVGNWPVHAVEYDGDDRGRSFYTAKDDAMLAEADFGFFAWDGKSKGTLRNIVKLAELRRPSTVYLSKTRQFVTVRSPSDANGLLDGSLSPIPALPHRTPVGGSNDGVSVQGTLFVNDTADVGGDTAGKDETRIAVAGRRKAPGGRGKYSKRKRQAG